MNSMVIIFGVYKKKMCGMCVAGGSADDERTMMSASEDRRQSRSRRIGHIHSGKLARRQFFSLSASDVFRSLICSFLTAMARARKSPMSTASSRARVTAV